MIACERRPILVKKAELLAAQLGDFKTPGSGEPVDPSRLAEVMRFVKANGASDLPELLKLLPGSYLRKASQSAPPQLEEVKRRVSPLAREITDAEELVYVLGWARRLLTIRETAGAASPDEPRRSGSGGRRGGPSRR